MLYWGAAPHTLGPCSHEVSFPLHLPAAAKLLGCRWCSKVGEPDVPVGTTLYRSGRTDASPKELPLPSALPLALGRLLLHSHRTAVSLSSPEPITVEMIWVNYVQSPEIHFQPSLPSYVLLLLWLFPLRTPLHTCLLPSGSTCCSRKELVLGTWTRSCCVSAVEAPSLQWTHTSLRAPLSWARQGAPWVPGPR